MALPINEVPRYTCKLPSTDEVIKYRPFLVKEEKILLMAIESNDENEISQAVINTVQTCVENDIDVSNLPIFDFEYLYLRIRAKSVGEVVKLKLKCPDDVKQIVDYELNLDDVKVTKPEGISPEVEFEPGYGVVLQYPTIKSFKGDVTKTELSFDIIKDCIKSIYKGDDVYDRNNVSDKELDDYVNSLTQKQYRQIMKFFDTMPRIEHTIKYKNPKTSKEFTLTLSGTNDFF